jgi:HTH-type transcriptional regulator / antitoxin HigA
MKTPDDPRYLGLFRLLAERIAVWEKEHEAIPEASPVEMLAFFMQQHGVSQYELDKEGIVDQSTLSKVLSGKRQISKNLAKKLAQRFHTSPEVFL